MNKLDSCLDDMENTRFLVMYGKMIRQFAASSAFNETEVACIIMIFHKLVLANGSPSRMIEKRHLSSLFVSLFDINDDEVISRILATITEDIKYIDAFAWLNLIETFMSTDLTKCLSFIFKVYDSNETGFLTRELVAQKVDKFFVGDDEDEINELRSDMVEMIFNKFDLDKDGVISYMEYSSVATKQPCLMEFLGQVFPTTGMLELLAYCSNLKSKILFFKM